MYISNQGSIVRERVILKPVQMKGWFNRLFTAIRAPHISGFKTNRGDSVREDIILILYGAALEGGSRVHIHFIINDSLLFQLEYDRA